MKQNSSKDVKLCMRWLVNNIIVRPENNIANVIILKIIYKFYHIITINVPINMKKKTNIAMRINI